MCRGHYPSADEYLNHAEKSDTTLVEAFKRMQVIEEEEPADTLDQNGEPDEEVLYLQYSVVLLENLLYVLITMPLFTSSSI